MADLKEACTVYKVIQVFTVCVILLGPKKIMSFIVDVMNTCDKESEERHTDVQVLDGRITLLLSCDETHVLWVELKTSVKLKSDNALACY